MNAVFALQAAVVLLFVRSLYLRSHRVTLIFLACVAPFSCWYSPETYAFNARSFGLPSVPAFHGGGVPIVNVLAFLFTFFLSLDLAGLRLGAGDGAPVLYGRLLRRCVAYFVVIGLTVEWANETLGWWSFFHQPQNLFSYVIMWMWRPAMAFSIFLPTLIADESVRRRRTAVALATAGAWAVAIAALWIAGAPVARINLATLVLSLLAFGVQWGAEALRKEASVVPAERLLFASPRPLFGR